MPNLPLFFFFSIQFKSLMDKKEQNNKGIDTEYKKSMPLPPRDAKSTHKYLTISLSHIYFK